MDGSGKSRPHGHPAVGRIVNRGASQVSAPRRPALFRRLLQPAAQQPANLGDELSTVSDSKQELWAWKRAIVERLARLRLTIHERPAQVVPVENGIPWLGFVVFPTHRRVKARKVRGATSRLSGRLDDYLAGRIPFAELDASVKGWVNHIRYADTWGLRRHVFAGLRFTMVPEKLTGATRPGAPLCGAAENQ